MKVWVERCQNYKKGRLTWEAVFTLAREAELRRDTNLTQREIDLAHG